MSRGRGVGSWLAPPNCVDSRSLSLSLCLSLNLHKFICIWSLLERAEIWISSFVVLRWLSTTIILSAWQYKYIFIFISNACREAEWARKQTHALRALLFVAKTVMRKNYSIVRCLEIRVRVGMTKQKALALRALKFVLLLQRNQRLQRHWSEVFPVRPIKALMVVEA